ncbi:MAG: TonB-dependent receptor domain-containing protein [Sediminibacterium sp.]
MKRFAFILSFLTIHFLSYAQNATLSGQVFDKSTQKVLPFVSVVVIQPTKDSTILTGAVSDEDGRFQLSNVPKGNYLVRASFIGYQNATMRFTVGSLVTAYDLGKIVLSPSNNQLGEVIVTGQREVVSTNLEKKTFNIADNLSQSGGSVLDALRNIPGVTIDAEGEVLIRGSENVLVLIDGKQSSLTGFGNQKGLDNLPASNIESIEIINNPSAKYNANGMAGIVNIIYKKNREKGWNGEYGLTVGVGELYQRKANLPNIMAKYAWTPKLNPTLSINYKNKKVNWFFQGDGMVRRRINTNTYTTRTYSDGTPSILSQFLENRSQQLYNLKGGLDWYITPRNTLTLFALWQDEYHIDRGDVPYDNLQTGKRIRLWGWAEDERTKFINYSAIFNHKFPQAGHELSLSYLYTGGGEDELFPFTDVSDTRNSTDGTFLTIYEYVNHFSLDYAKPLRAGRVEFGSKISLRNIPLTYTLYPGTNSILDPKLGAYSNYKEDIYAFYGNYLFEKPAYNIEAGLRFEPTNVHFTLDPANVYYKENAYQYRPLFPNVRFTYKLNENNTLSAFFNRRVDRPGEFDVRPFPKYDDPEILKTGNPNLRPQFTKTYELAYKRFLPQGSFYLSGFYRQIDNIFTRVYTQDNSSTIYNIVNTIPANLGNGTNLGVEATYQTSLSKNWKFNGGITWYQNHINAFSGTHYYPTQQPFSFAAQTVNTWNLKLNSTAQLPHLMDLQLTAVYYAPDIVPQGKTDRRFSFDFGLRKKMANGKTEWRLSGTDLLNTFAIRQTFEGTRFTLRANNYYETQVVTLGVKHKF